MGRRMNWAPKLHGQKSSSCSCSCSCLAMDIRSWCNSGSKSIRLGRRFMENDYDDFETFSFPATRSNTPRWRVLWRRIKKEQKKFFYSSARFQVPYDPYTYSQNFDQGSAWTEPDNLSRSFSARFADPSRIFQKKGLVG